MADQYQTTDRLAENTNPQVARLLLEDNFVFDTTDYSAVTGGYLASEEIEITNLNDLGNRQKGFSPQTFYAEAMISYKLTPGGQVDDYFWQFPYTIFVNRSTGEVDSQAYYEFHNVWITGDETFASYLTFYHFEKTQPTRDRQISYKIYSTIYQFEDVD